MPLTNSLPTTTDYNMYPQGYPKSQAPLMDPTADMQSGSVVSVSPTLKSYTNAITNVVAQNIFQDGAIPNISISGIQANTIKGGSIQGVNVRIGAYLINAPASSNTFTITAQTGSNSTFQWINSSGTQTMLLDGSGNWAVAGTKSSIEETSQGTVKLYAVESPEVLYQDFGSAMVEKGSAIVEVDQLYVEVTRGSYQVWLTGLGEYQYLYYKRLGRSNFEICCDKDIEVNWMIVAHRKNHDDKRFEKVDQLKNG